MTEAHERFEYNSNREKLLIPEYGRHVQKMLEHARTIEDKEQRQMFVELVVRLMEQMQSSNSRPTKELTDKLWNHAFMIGGYELDVEAPEDVTIVKHQGYVRPPKLEYPYHESKYRHYGYNVQQLIEKAKKMEDEEKRTKFMTAIASYMKLAYKTWNRDHYVNDEVIKSDLKRMSGGELVIAEETPLDFLQYTNVRSNVRSKSKRSNNGKQRSKGHRRRKK
ncbi:MAG: DUF4290 domain-containing protein [Saprospiraceae bacterium]|nr:DUF4290 domain-containing protein [Saprospiraceae bacterium]